MCSFWYGQVWNLLADQDWDNAEFEILLDRHLRMMSFTLDGYQSSAPQAIR
jgi:hypothetical protein